MFYRINDINGYALDAVDVKIGRTKDMLFDDRAWVVRYLVADTHKWLPGGKKVVISPVSLMPPDNEDNSIPVRLTRKEIEDAPDLEEHKPISRQYEINLFDHLGYGYYWMGNGMWGPHLTPVGLTEGPIEEQTKKTSVSKEEERHLRSTNEVGGYHIKTLDGQIGMVTEFILDTRDWSIPYLVIDTHTWMPFGKKVVVPTSLLDSVSWVERTVEVELTTKQVAKAPEYDFKLFNSHKYQKALDAYYKTLQKENELSAVS